MKGFQDYSVESSSLMDTLTMSQDLSISCNDRNKTFEDISFSLHPSILNTSKSNFLDSNSGLGTSLPSLSNCLPNSNNSTHYAQDLLISSASEAHDEDIKPFISQLPLSSPAQLPTGTTHPTYDISGDLNSSIISSTVTGDDEKDKMMNVLLTLPPSQNFNSSCNPSSNATTIRKGVAKSSFVHQL